MEVASSASQTLKRVHLELGGKAPVIVFDDVDIASAAENIAIAGYFNAGQDCTAATRVLAGPKVYGDFVDALAEQARNTVIGPPDNDDALFGPVNNVNQFQRVTGVPRSRARALDSSPLAATKSATPVLHRANGRRRSPPRRRDDSERDFGPVITVQKFSDDAEALAWANGVRLRVGVVSVDE